MDPEQGGLSRWRRELRNHPVIRVAGAYCVVAWVLMQAGEIILPSFDAPAWIMQSLITTLVAGLPVVIILARLTRLPRLIGLSDPRPLATVPPQGPEPSQEVGDILRLTSASLNVPMDLSESRQITTLACSLVGLLNGADDPELLLGFLAGLEAEVGAAVERYEGARLPSSRNEILVAFGFPVAHEDDARRAAKLAVELLALIRAHDVADGPDTEVIARIGLHTATIIVDEHATESDVVALLGDSVGVASYLQAAAPDGGVALSQASGALLRASFLLEELGRQTHPRLGREVPVFGLGRELNDQLAIVMAEQSEVVGREHEQRLLLQQWQAVVEGESEYVLIKGEPGMGKSSLVYHTVKDLVASGSAQLVLLTCEPYYRDVPFRPVLNFLERSVLGQEGLDPQQRRLKLQAFLDERLGEHDEEAVVLLSALLSAGPEEDMALDASSKQVREKTLSMMVSLMERFSRRLPLVIAVEDMQWADPSTRDLIERLLVSDPTAPIFGLFTARPEFQPDWANLPDVMELNLNKLSTRAARELVERQAGAGTLAPELVNQLIDSAAGIPLYLEQLTRTVLERREAGGQGQDGPVAITIPATLKASLAARIDNLGSAKPLLQLCSVLGFEFSYELLRAVCEASNEKLLRTVLNTIVNAGLIYQKGALPQATFKFKHRLIMEVASQSLLRRTRQQLHEVIAQKLEAQFAELCQTRPTQVAHHFNLAGNAEKAIEYWIRAAQLSQAKFANEEALAQVQRGLGALKDVADEKPRRQLEITLQSLLGAIQLASRGYTNPEVRVAFERALELSSQVEQTPALFRMVVGLWMYYLIRGEYQRARELSDQQLQIAGRIGESPELLQANYCAGYTRYYCGELTSALAFLEQGLAHSESDADFTRQTPSRDDSRIHLYCVYAAALWSSGAPQASRDYLQRALTLARELDEPYGLVWALNWAVWLEHMRGESERVARYAGEMLDISQAKGISFFVPLAMFFLASVSPDRESRLESLLTCYGMVKSAGARAGIGYMGEVVIRELIEHGELQRAREWAQDNAAGIAERGERIFLCENQRLQALLARDLDGDLEACIRQLEEAVAQARELGNLPFALAGALTLHEQAGCAARAQGLIADLLAGYAGEDDCAHYRRAREIAGDAAGLSA